MMVNPSDDGRYERETDLNNRHQYQLASKIIQNTKDRKISIGYGNPQSKEILKMINDISIVRIFASVTEPMTVREICKKAKVSKTTLYRKISELEELKLLVRKGRSAKDTENLGTWVYEKSFQSIKVNFENNPCEPLIVITPKEKYFARIVRRLRN